MLDLVLCTNLTSHRPFPRLGGSDTTAVSLRTIFYCEKHLKSGTIVGMNACALCPDLAVFGGGAEVYWSLRSIEADKS